MQNTVAKVLTKKQLLDAIKDCNDDDDVVIEVFDCVLQEDLYEFTVDIVNGVRMENGTTKNEIRFSAVPNS